MICVLVSLDKTHAQLVDVVAKARDGRWQIMKHQLNIGRLAAVAATRLNDERRLLKGIACSDVNRIPAFITACTRKGMSAADLSPSAPLPPPAFDLLDRVTKVKTTGDIGTVCALVPGCETGSPGVFSYWLYRVAWDNGFPGPGVASEQLNDAAWLSMHCLRPEELPASDLAPAVMSRQ